MSRIFSSAVAFLLILSSCTTGDKADIEGRIFDKVKLCHFVPTLKTVESLISLFGGPKLPVVDQVADAICSTVDKARTSGFVAAPSGKDSSFGTYKGVSVIGRTLKQ